MSYSIFHIPYSIFHIPYGIWNMEYGIWNMTYAIPNRLIRIPPCLLVGFLFAERLGEEALRRGLRIVVIVTIADRLVVFGDGAFALADGVPGIAAINV